MINKTILSIDFSLNGSAIVFGSTKDVKDNNYGILAFNYFSNLKSDLNNEHCRPIPDGINGTDKLDNLICYFLSVINKVDFVVLESASFNSQNSSTDFQGGYHIIRYLCRRLDIECLEIPPITNKLFFTDNARATKQEMVNKAIEKFSNIIDFNKISKKHREDVSDALSLYELGYTYLKCNRLPAPKGYVGTSDIKYYDTLPLHQKQVIARLYNRDDLYNEAKKQRDKIKKLDKKQL